MFNGIVCVIGTKTKVLSEELRTEPSMIKAKTIKQSISKEIDVPVTTVASITKKFKAYGTAANHTGHLTQGCWMVEKEPRHSSKQIQGELQSSGYKRFKLTIRTNLNKVRLHSKRPRTTPLLKLIKFIWSLPICRWTSHSPSGRTSFGLIKRNWSFVVDHSNCMVSGKSRGVQGEHQHSHSETWRGSDDVLGMLCHLWNRNVLNLWMAEWN